MFFVLNKDSAEKVNRLIKTIDGADGERRYLGGMTNNIQFVLIGSNTHSVSGTTVYEASIVRLDTEDMMWEAFGDCLAMPANGELLTEGQILLGYGFGMASVPYAYPSTSLQVFAVSCCGTPTVDDGCDCGCETSPCYLVDWTGSDWKFTAEYGGAILAPQLSYLTQREECCNWKDWETEYEYAHNGGLSLFIRPSVDTPPGEINDIDYPENAVVLRFSNTLPKGAWIGDATDWNCQSPLTLTKVQPPYDDEDVEGMHEHYPETIVIQGIECPINCYGDEWPVPNTVCALFDGIGIGNPEYEGCALYCESLHGLTLYNEDCIFRGEAECGIFVMFEKDTTLGTNTWRVTVMDFNFFGIPHERAIYEVIDDTWDFTTPLTLNIVFDTPYYCDFPETMTIAPNCSGEPFPSLTTDTFVAEDENLVGISTDTFVALDPGNTLGMTTDTYVIDPDMTEYGLEMTTDTFVAEDTDNLVEMATDTFVAVDEDNLAEMTTDTFVGEDTDNLAEMTTDTFVEE